MWDCPRTLPVVSVAVFLWGFENRIFRILQGNPKKEEWRLEGVDMTSALRFNRKPLIWADLGRSSLPLFRQGFGGTARNLGLRFSSHWT